MSDEVKEFIVYGEDTKREEIRDISRPNISILFYVIYFIVQWNVISYP